MIAVAILIAAFLGGAFTGLLVLLRLAMIREQRKPFSPKAHTPATAASRLVTGLYVRRPQNATPPGYLTAQFGPGQERRPAAIPGAGPPITGGAVLPEIGSRARNASEMQTWSYEWRDE